MPLGVRSEEHATAAVGAERPTISAPSVVSPEHRRRVVIDGAYAARLDDLNGDYREMCLTVFQRAGSEWAELAYADDVGFPAVGGTTAYGCANGFAFIECRAQPRARIRVVVGDEPRTVLADDERWWLHVRPAQAPRRAIADRYVRVGTG
jgi:hypothetical protein